MPGTTRDAIDTRLAWGRSEVVLIDTAGIRRRGKVASGPAAEKYSTLRALRALGRADVAVLVIDAVEGLTAQDAHVAGYVVEEGKGLVIAVNKWDLLEEKTDRTFDQYTTWIRNEVPFLDFAPIISISAKTGQRVGRVLEAAVDIWGERRRRIGTGELNRLLTDATDRFPPPVVRGRRPKLFYATQAAVAPPTFVFFASDAASVHFSYRRYLENRLRETFGFDGTPIRLVFRDRTSVKLPRHKRNPGKAGGPKASMSKGSKPRRPVRSRRNAGGTDEGARHRCASSHARSAGLGALMRRAARRGRRGRCVGDHAGQGHRPRRAGHARRATPPRRRPRSTRPASNERRLPGVDLPARRHRDGGRRGAGGGDRSRAVRRPVGPPADRGRVVRRSIWRSRGRAVGGQGPRTRHAPADERGHRPGRRRSSPGRIAALSGPNLAAEVARNLPASAVVAADGPRAGASGSSRAWPDARFRLYVNQDILGVELAGALKNVVAIAAGAADGLGFRRQRQGRAADPRSGRDDAAGDRGRRQPADLRRAGRDGRPHRDVRVQPVAQPPARRGTRQGPDLGGDRGGPARAPPRAPTRSRRRSRWPIASASTCRSPARSTAPCSRARASSAASWTCSPASRRTSSRTRRPGWLAWRAEAADPCPRHHPCRATNAG